MDILRKTLVIIGPLLLLYIFVEYIDVGKFVLIYRHASPAYLMLACFFNTLLIFGKIHRIYRFMGNSSIKANLFSLMKMYVYANFLGQVSNLIVSDVVNAGALMSNGEKKIRITNIFLFNRISDLSSIMALFAVFFFINHGLIAGYVEFNHTFILLSAFIIPLCAPFLLPFRKTILSGWHDLLDMIRGAETEIILYIVAIYSGYCLTAVCNATALHIVVPWTYILLTYLLGSLVTIIPISVAGIGTRDVLFIFLLKIVHVSSESAVALSLLAFVFIPYVSLVILLGISVLGKKIEDSHYYRH